MKNSLNQVSVRKSEDGTYVHSTKNPDIAM